MKQRPFAVFDIDGTIIRWQLYHAIADELAREGKLDESRFREVRKARMAWKRRNDTDAYRTYEEALVDLYEKAITSIKVSDLEAACRKVIDEYKDQVYTYTRDLIRQLKESGYLLFAISASQNEVVKLLAEYYQFDDYGGSLYEVKNGSFTGQREILKSERKPEYLKLLVEKHNASLEGSIGVGDSEGDIAMLSAVNLPIAFNPANQLYEHARSQGWPIVVERKNVIYKLEPANESYILV